MNMLHNFNSGPSILPQEVLQQASEAIFNFNNTGLSILEIGLLKSYLNLKLKFLLTLLVEILIG
jgi:phosphoserine aminotransferase